MDYSLLKATAVSTPENLSLSSPSPFAHYLLDERVRILAPTASSSPTMTTTTTLGYEDADDALLMDCSRSTSSAVTPNPHEICAQPPTKSSTPTDSTKLKLNFSMDRILSREPEPRNRFTQPTNEVTHNSDPMTWISASQAPATEASTPYECELVAGGGAPPVTFSVASMLGLGAAAGGCQSVYRPMPLYLSQSGKKYRLKVSCMRGCVAVRPIHFSPS